MSELTGNIDETVRESEELFRATFNQAAVGIAHVALDGAWLRINRKMCDIVGYTEEELRRLTFKDITHPDDVAASTDNIRRALVGKVSNYSLEKRYIRKNGEIVWANVTVSLVRRTPANKGYFIVIVEDITSRKKGEEELRRLTEQLHEQAGVLDAILSASPNHIFHVDREGVYRYASRAALKALRMAPADIIGKKWREMGFPPEIMERIDREREKVQASGQDSRGESAHPTPQGTRHFEYSINPIQGGHEENAGVVITAWDITEHKRVEEELEILYKDIVLRAFDLEAANRELEAFNYTVSHDLRKPLTIINGYCQIITEFCRDKLTPECREYLREINDWTMRMSRLIDALLKFSHMSHCDLHRETVDLCAMARAVASELQLAEPERRVTFSFADTAPTEGDPGLLQTALENLLGNAWKYTGRRDNAVIEFGQVEIDGRPAWFVRDNGEGFDMTYAEKLFIPFQRLPGTDAFKGHGIGLATVERIIRRHGGRVWAEGEAGRGATFFFTLAP